MRVRSFRRRFGLGRRRRSRSRRYLAIGYRM
jgi:hypothetical protein